MKGWFASVSRAEGQRAAAAGFNSRPACQGDSPYFSQRELTIARIGNGANDWLMERHLAARKDGHI